jgi:hypothetical protein
MIPLGLDLEVYPWEALTLWTPKTKSLLASLFKGRNKILSGKRDGRGLVSILPEFSNSEPDFMEMSDLCQCGI